MAIFRRKKSHRTAGLDQIGPSKAPHYEPFGDGRPPPMVSLPEWRKELMSYKSGQGRRVRTQKSKITLPGDSDA